MALRSGLNDQGRQARDVAVNHRVFDEAIQRSSYERAALRLESETGEDDMHLDAVFWGSIISVALAVIIIGYLVFKVIKLMNEDAERHKSEQQ
jgi:large-conductance mechanosensitive channel